MPLAVRRSASSTAMRPIPHRSMSTSGAYPYPYAYLYTYDTLFNNSLGMTSSTAGAPSSSRRRRQRVSGALGLSDDDDSRRRRRMRRGPSSGSLLTNTYTSTSTRPRTRRVASEGSAPFRQVLAEIEWWRVVQGQRDPDADFDLDGEEDADDEDTPGLEMEDVSDNAEDDDTPVYSPSIPPLTRARSHAHAQDDFTLTHSFSAHSRTSSSSSSDSELEVQHRVPRGAMLFPTSALKFNGSPIGASIFPSTSLTLVDDEHDDISAGEFNEIGSASASTPNAIVKAALATLFPSSSSTPPAEWTSACSSSSQLPGFSLSIPVSQHDTSDVGIYTPALPQSSRVRAISLPDASNVGVMTKTKHSKLPGPFSDDMFSEALGNL